MTGDEVDAMLAKARDEAARNALRVRRPHRNPVAAAFEAIVTEAGGDLAVARQLVEQRERAGARERQLDVAPSMFETPAEYAERLERSRESERRRLLASAGLRDRYRDADLGNVSRVPADDREEYRAVVAKVRRKLQTPGAIVALTGPWGPGKTHIGSGLVREFCRCQRSAVYTTVVGYFLRVEAEFRPGGRPDAADRRFRRASLLVLDELQAKGYSDARRMRLTDLLDERYGNLLATLIISNDSGDELWSSLGNIGDRMRDGGGEVPFDAPSLRGRIGGPTE